MKILLYLFSSILILNASEVLNIDEALKILSSNNLEIHASKLDVSIAKENENTIKGMNWGKLDFIQDFANSNDAGNVFGFKLSSREATFGDFGFSEFSVPTTPSEGAVLLATVPNDLNHPEVRNYFQTRLKYELPLFTGFMISSYSNIMHSMTKMKTLEQKQIINEKKYQLRKSFYDMALLNTSINNLTKIIQNIEKLEYMTQNMIDVGYAKHIDLLEVKAKKGNVNRLLVQMNSNKKLLYHYISFLLNRKVTTIETPLSDLSIPSISNSDVLQNNLNIQKANNGLKIKEEMLNISQASYYPSVGAFAEVSTADNTFLGDVNNHKAYTLGARLTWNIFNGGVDRSKIEQSKLDNLKMKSLVILAQKGIILKLDKIRTEIQGVNEEISSLEKELEFADAIYKNYEGRYIEKLSSMSDVIIKQSAQIEKILQLQMAKNKRNEKIFALEKLANGENENEN